MEEIRSMMQILLETFSFNHCCDNCFVLRQDDI
jgi:hypothetical protein